MRFNNLSDICLKSLYISIEQFDDTGKLLDNGQRVEFAYLDLNIPHNNTFGDNVPIVLNNAMIRQIKVYIEKYKLGDDVIEIPQII